ncbi:MAG: ABC transporter permease subunit [Planctomycetota bacterium]|nr:ABC transporter permease subunit [Planctomycetota bacterium]
MNGDAPRPGLLDFVRDCWRHAPAGPVLDKELRIASRRRSTYLVRAGYVVVLGLFVLVVWGETVLRPHMSPVTRVWQLAEAGKTIVAVVTWVQFVVLQLLAIASLSSAVSDEVNRRTLGVLMATPVTGFQIVMGKLAGRLLHLLLLLAISLPVLMMVRVLGGVRAGYVLSGYGITLTAVLFCGALALWLSIHQRRPWAVMLTAVSVMGFLWLVLPYTVLFYLQNSLTPSPLTADSVATWTAYGDPWLALLSETSDAVAPGRRSGPLFVWPIHCLVMLGLSAVLVAVSAVQVRRAGMRQALGGDEPHASAPPRDVPSWVSLRRVFGPPVVWLETRRRVFRRRWMAVIVALVAVGILAFTYLATDRALREPVVRGLYGVALMTLGALATAVLAATAIAAEKESQTWPVLLCTPLTSREIVMGKAVGAARRSAPVWGLLALHVMVFVAAGWTPPVALLHVAMVATGLAAFVTGTGILFSVLLRKTTSAVVANVALGAVIWAVAPLLVLLIFEWASGRSSAGELAICVNPAAQIVVALSQRGQEAYDWPGPLHSSGLLDTTLMIGATAMVYLAAGVLCLAIASRRVRRHEAPLT